MRERLARRSGVGAGFVAVLAGLAAAGVLLLAGVPAVSASYVVGTCTADSSYTGQNPASICDYSDTTFWASGHVVGEHWVLVDLGSSTWVGTYRLLQKSPYAAGYFVESSDDFATWTLRGTEVATSLDKTTAVGVKARYWRARGTTTYGTGEWQVSAFSFEIGAAPTSSGGGGGGSALICPSAGPCLTVALDDVGLGELSGVRSALLVLIALGAALGVAVLLVKVTD